MYRYTVHIRIAAVKAGAEGLTFELSCARRLTPTGRGRTMTTVAWSGQAVAVVARRLERVVRPHSQRTACRMKYCYSFGCPVLHTDRR
jgi:hypothetical protein